MTAMLPAPLVIGTSLAYLLLLVGVAYWADRRAAARRSVIARPWVYALSMAVYCTAWTYFGSVERAATGGMWFLPIYLGPTLAMVLGWTVLRKMIRIAKTHRITSIADFIASRYGKSQLLATLVTLVAVVGIVPYIALQLKAVSSGYALLTSGKHGTRHAKQQAVQPVTARSHARDRPERLFGDGLMLTLRKLSAMDFHREHRDQGRKQESGDDEVWSVTVLATRAERRLILEQEPGDEAIEHQVDEEVVARLGTDMTGQLVVHVGLNVDDNDIAHDAAACGLPRAVLVR